MASSSNHNNPHTTNQNTCFPPSLPASFDPNSSANTTFVQADPSNFRAVVQKLTGATQDPSAQKLPVTLPARSITGKLNSGEVGPRRPAFKLHERRQSARKLEIKLNNAATGNNTVLLSSSFGGSPSSSTRQRSFFGGGFNGGEMFMVSPVSPLDLFTHGCSPRTPMSPLQEEEKAIAEKGFYLHRSPLSTPRGSEKPPELLPLFPLQSPTNNDSPSSFL